MKSKITAIVLAGGTGTRLGSDIPKQYLYVNCKMIITYALETLINSPLIGNIRIVAGEEWREEILKDLSDHQIDSSKISGFSGSGTTRQYSILNALDDVKKDNATTDSVFIHDAARPLLADSTIEALVKAINDDGHDGAMPVLPMKDTVYLSEDGTAVSSLIDRSKLFAGQAPEIFVFDKYYKANKHLHDEGKLSAINGSTEPAILEGMDIAMIPGDERNFKITTRADMDRFTEIVCPLSR